MVLSTEWFETILITYNPLDKLDTEIGVLLFMGMDAASLTPETEYILALLPAGASIFICVDAGLKLLRCF